MEILCPVGMGAVVLDFVAHRGRGIDCLITVLGICFGTVGAIAVMEDLPRFK